MTSVKKISEMLAGEVFLWRGNAEVYIRTPAHDKSDIAFSLAALRLVGPANAPHESGYMNYFAPGVSAELASLDVFNSKGNLTNRTFLNEDQD